MIRKELFVSIKLITNREKIFKHCITRILTLYQINQINYLSSLIKWRKKKVVKKMIVYLENVKIQESMYME